MRKLLFLLAALAATAAAPARAAAPDFSTSTLTVTLPPDGRVIADDVVTLIITVTNSGDDTSVGTILTLDVPLGFDYEGDSLTVTSGVTTTTLTDEADDDAGEYATDTTSARARLGVGANGQVGGSLAPGQSVVVRLQARASGAVFGPVPWQGVVRAEGLTGSALRTYPTDGNAAVPGAQATVITVDVCRADSQCPVEAPLCATDLSPRRCVDCATNANCPANKPLCDTAARECKPCGVSPTAACTDGARPACAFSGPLVGQCLECTADDRARCTGDTPLCNTQTGTCVACLSNAECGGATPLCDSTTARCVSCAVDPARACVDSALPACRTTGPLAGRCAQCTTADTRACAPLGFVRCDEAAGACVECLSSADCSGARPFCDLATKACQPCTAAPSACADPARPACNAGGALAGRCTECSSSDASLCVGARPFCNTNSGQCAECRVSSDCPSARPFCDPATRACVGCAQNPSVCTDPVRPACQTSGPLAGACVECSANNATRCIGARPFCDAPQGVCIGCRSNADCGGTTPVCDATSRTCQPCATNPSICSDPTRPACASDGPRAGACVECTSSQSGRCAAPRARCDVGNNVCVGCLGNGDCSEATPYCDPATATCKPCGERPLAACTDPLRPACNTSGGLAGTCTECGPGQTARCTSERPLCRASSGTCVGCLSNTDCTSADAPYCDLVSGTCRPCGAEPARACVDPARPVCQTSGALAGRCTECSASSRQRCVAPFDRCDERSGRCAACVSNADCPPAAPLCDSATLSCRPCSANPGAACSDATRGACNVGGPLAGQCTECTATDTTRCPAERPNCNDAGACVGCNGATDCPPLRPICDPTTRLCRACGAGTGAGCPSDQPVCRTEGPFAGSCGTCSTRDRSRCPANAPLCLESGNRCVACRDDDDCGGLRPTCDPSTNTCVPCTVGGCAEPRRPVCRRTGPLAGSCAECSISDARLCGGAQPACLTELGLCGCSDQDGDRECGESDSGRVCSGPAGLCVGGCSKTPGRNDCPTGWTCQVAPGATVGACLSPVCRADGDCRAPSGRCDVAAGQSGGTCVECLGDTDCGRGLRCATTGPRAKTCVQCTPEHREQCARQGPGAACLQDGTCGCNTDADCGEANHGRYCHPTLRRCLFGCSNASNCPSGYLCTSTSDVIGVCVLPPDGGGFVVPVPDAGAVPPDGSSGDGGAQDGGPRDGGVRDGGADAGPPKRACIPDGGARQCDDQNACTSDKCDTTSKTCKNTPVAIGAPCGKGGICVSAVCTQPKLSGTGCAAAGDDTMGWLASLLLLMAAALCRATRRTKVRS